MDHFYVVPGRFRSQVGYTGLALEFGGNRFKNGLYLLVGLLISPRHDAGATSGSFCAPGNPRAKKVDTLALQIGFPAIGIRKERIPSVYNKIVSIQIGQ